MGGDVFGVVLNHANVYDFAFAVDVMFVCIYGLSVVMFFASVGRSRRKASRIAAHVVPDAEGFSAVKDSVGKQAERSAGPIPSEGCLLYTSRQEYGTFEAYLDREFGLTGERLKALRDRYLE